MKLGNPLHLWRDLSVSKKLYGVVGVMAILIAAELFTLLFAMSTLSSMRAFVGGEGLWSKAQKNAMFEIQKYITSRDEADFRAFQESLKVNFGDRKARLEMMKPDMDVAKVTEGFLEGKNHPRDIPSMIRLMRDFHHVSYIKDAIRIWSEADAVLSELDALGGRIHHAIHARKLHASTPEVRALVTELSDINNRLTVLEDEFSYTLGEASRWLEDTLIWLLLVAVLTVEATGLFLTISFTRGLGRSLAELNSAAKDIGAGNFEREVPARSRDELGQLALAINKMTENLRTAREQKQQAAEASEIKSLFLANMSHEIRTPLGAILGFVELLREKGITETERAKYLDIVQRTGESLATIINDILDISKIEAGKLEVVPARCALTEMLKDLSLLLRLRCEHKGIYLKITPVTEIPENIYTDGARLKQILMNVIGNAIKFTNKGGVEVTYGVDSGFLEFSVADTGIGIPQEEMVKLFQPFSQVDLSVRKVHGGTGLGLVLSKRLAQLLGGDVSLDRSEKGKGSVFKVRVKMMGMVVPRAQDKIETQTQHALSLTGMRLLLVEDNIDNQLLIRSILSKCGAEVEVCKNGLEGVAVATTGKFDVVLMDMQMPVMDGYSATEELRRRGFKFPIIGITAHAMKEDIEKSIASGCNTVVTKPIKATDLVKVILAHCVGR